MKDYLAKQYVEIAKSMYSYSKLPIEYYVAALGTDNAVLKLACIWMP